MSRIDANTPSIPANFTEIKGTDLHRTNIFSRDDANGVPPKGLSPDGGLPLPLLVGGKADMQKVMAAFEDLIILMSKMAKEIQVGERESELTLMASKISHLLTSANTKEEGADKMRGAAIASLVISVVSAAISLIGAGISLGGAVKGASAAAKGIEGLDLKGADKIKTMATLAENASSKLVKGGAIADGVGKGIQGGAGYASTDGQAQNQIAQAKADRIAAEAENDGAQATRSQQMQQDMRDLLSKMLELLNSFYAAQDKISSAASH